MLKNSNFSKARNPKVHTGAFNPMTLSSGAADQLNKGTGPRSVQAPEHDGTGVVYTSDPMRVPGQNIDI